MRWRGNVEREMERDRRRKGCRGNVEREVGRDKEFGSEVAREM